MASGFSCVEFKESRSRSAVKEAVQDLVRRDDLVLFASELEGR